jgi:hypothetical protein
MSIAEKYLKKDIRTRKSPDELIGDDVAVRVGVVSFLAPS